MVQTKQMDFGVLSDLAHNTDAYQNNESTAPHLGLRISPQSKPKDELESLLLHYSIVDFLCSTFVTIMVEKEIDEETVAHLVAPHADDSDTRITVTDATSPWSCCGGSGWWHPTAAVVRTADGVQYLWNSRAHRKLRYPKGPADKHPEKWRHRIKFLGWEPSIVTWWNVWIGVIANTLWVVNGLYATWPGQASSADAATMISYVTGVVGAFLFIVTGYLGKCRLLRIFLATVAKLNSCSLTHYQICIWVLALRNLSFRLCGSDQSFSEAHQLTR